MGLVLKFDFGDGRARQELSEGPRGTKHHHHLVCIVIMELSTIQILLTKKLSNLAGLKKGFPKNSISKLQITLFNFTDYVTNVRINEGQGDKL